ncbi:MAG: hypothetical protein M3066_01160, partial [Actinomycetota bacterium]|nr:hypothetical protein [Actinomycetota bacterium]
METSRPPVGALSGDARTGERHHHRDRADGQPLHDRASTRPVNAIATPGAFSEIIEWRLPNNKKCAARRTKECRLWNNSLTPSV